MFDQVQRHVGEGEFANVELPEFQGIETVRAAKVVSTAFHEGGYRLALEGGAHVDVTRNWVANHHPVAGGFYVQREDGTAAFVNADAFTAKFAAEEAQGSGSERNGPSDWTQAGDGTGYPTDADADTSQSSGLVFETKNYSDGSSATGVAPLPALSPDQQAAAQEPDVIAQLQAAPPAPIVDEDDKDSKQADE
jgi:hypothetical protein